MERFKKHILLTTLFVVISATITVIYQQYFLFHHEKLQPLLPNFIKEISSLNTIKITSKNDTTTLEKNGSDWVIKEKYNLPSNQDYIKAMLLNLQQANVIAQKTSDPLRYNKLGLDPNSSVRVSLYNKDSLTPVVDLYIGKTMEALEGTYVLNANSPTALLCSGNLMLIANPSKWFNHKKLSLDIANIQQIEIKHSKKPYILFRNNLNDKIFTIKNLPKNYIEKHNFLSNNIVTSLNDFGIEDIRDKLPNSKIDLIINIKYFNKKTSSINIYNHEKKKWLKFDNNPYYYQISDTGYKLLAPNLDDLISLP